MKYAFPKEKIKILFLENIHQSAIDSLKHAGYTNLETLSTALSEEELIEKIQDIHFIGIRSCTKITEKVLHAAKKLIGIGCFCIGTNQVDLDAAKKLGIAVFNAPFSNTRSVAELVMAECVMLMRRTFEKSSLAHTGVWQKSANHCYEVRGKNLGIVGYGHIGSQFSVLAEAFGMNVFYYDVEKKLQIGNAKPCTSLEELFALSDIVSLHVPATPQTKNMITKKELSWMKKGSYLINASRGNVVDIEALREALEQKHLLGAAIDVFPKEPASNSDAFVSPLQGLSNIILTPHIGGSTIEAQKNIGEEVAEKIIKYSDNGSTVGSVNFPEVLLPANDGKHRFLHIHKNVPGILFAINELFASKNANIACQYLQTDPEIGYVVIDIDAQNASEEIVNELKNIPGTIKARILY